MCSVLKAAGSPGRQEENEASHPLRNLPEASGKRSHLPSLLEGIDVLSSPPVPTLRLFLNLQKRQEL